MDRKIININPNWKFHYGECEEAFYKGYDDSNFQSVDLPHDWSVEMPFERTNSSGTGYLSGGIGWYRLHINLPEEYRGKHIVLKFDGIYKNSQVYVNGYNLGKHPNGYTPVVYDISEFACFGAEENVIAVKVIHQDLADSRWFTGSGITRKASIIVEEKVHAADNGIYLYTTELVNSDDSEAVKQAKFVIHSEFENDQDESVEATVIFSLFDIDDKKQCKLVANYERNELIEAKGKSVMELEGEITNPILWDVLNPHLYILRTSIKVDDITSICDEHKIGLRTAVFDSEKGFFLNGENTLIKGVCVHHDAGVLGAAVTKEVWERRLIKLKECGCNAIRCSHNPHMPELYELCDELGFMMMDEAFDEWECAKNKWSTGHNVYPPKHQGYAEDFPQWHEADLKAMVRRDRKHPSVIMWSIGNEIDYPNDPYCHPSFETMTGNNDANKPKAERMYDPNKPNAERMITIADELSRIVKQEDESRPVTMALAFPELSAKLGIFKALDVAGYNYKEHLYDETRRDYPNTPIIGSENGHGYKQWKYILDNEYMSGQFLWTGIDYLGEAKGWPIHGSAAGLLTLAGFEKHRYMARKSYWLDKPVVELATREAVEIDNEWIPLSKCWNYEEGQNILVKCFSNLAKITLMLNGNVVATQCGYNADGAYQFEIPFEKGELVAIGCDADGNEKSRDVLHTVGVAEDIKVCVYKYNSCANIIECCDDPASNTIVKDISIGKDDNEIGYIYQLEVSLIDKDSNAVICDDRNISVQVIGAGELKGLENGNLADNTPYTEKRRTTFGGKLLIYVRRTKIGNIDVKIEMN